MPRRYSTNKKKKNMNKKGKKCGIIECDVRWKLISATDTLYTSVRNN